MKIGLEKVVRIETLDRMREVATTCLDKEWSDSNHVTRLIVGYTV